MSYRTKPLPPGTPAKVDRIRYLLELMSSGGYYGHKTCFELADKWNLSWDTIRQDANIAGLMLKLGPDEIPAAKVQMAEWYRSLAEKVLECPSNITGQPEWRSAIEAMRLFGAYSGIYDKAIEDAADPSIAREPIKIEIITVAKTKPPKPDE